MAVLLRIASLSILFVLLVKLAAVRFLGLSALVCTDTEEVTAKVDFLSALTDTKEVTAKVDSEHQGTCWCRLDLSNTQVFHHLPHAAQSLFPCWTFLSECKKCGFLLMDDLPIAPWTRTMIDLMDCDVSRNETEIEGDIYTLPQDFKFLWTTPDKARILQDRLQPKLPKDHTQIAIVDRKNSRSFANLQNIEAAIRQNLSSKIELTVAYMEEMTPRKQLEFWHQYDLILVGHGGSMANAIATQATIIEVYPEHYYPVIFQKLMAKLELPYLPYFNNVTDTLADTEEHWDDRRYWRRQNLEPNPETVLDLVRQALAKIENF